MHGGSRVNAVPNPVRYGEVWSGGDGFRNERVERNEGGRVVLADAFNGFYEFAYHLLSFAVVWLIANSSCLCHEGCA